MRNLILVFYLALSAFLLNTVSTNSQEIEKTNNGILILNQESLRKAIHTHDLLVVTFCKSYQFFFSILNKWKTKFFFCILSFLKIDASWCKHSKAWLKEHDIVLQKIQKSSPKVVFAKIDADADENKPVKDEFHIQGFPTIKLFIKGKPTEYLYEAKSTTFIAWLNKMLKQWK